MTSSIRHVAVLFDASAAAERALFEAASIADEHESELTVISSVPHDRRRVGCAICSVRRDYWNATLDEVVEGDLAKARIMLGPREPAPHFRAISGSGVATVRREAVRLGCDLFVVPNRSRFRRRPPQRLPRAPSADILEARSP